MTRVLNSFSAAMMISGLISSAFGGSIASANVKSTYFSPYADLTINAHWDSHYQDMEPMDLVKISQLSGVKNFHLAFITDAGNCSPAWGGQSSYVLSSAWGSHLTDRLRANAIDYTISFGGASGTDLSRTCSQAKLITSFEQVLKTYQPQGLDFDIENGSADVFKIMNALKRVQAIHPNLKISFTLPVLPEGLTASGQDVVKQAKAQGLHYAVNIMAMDFGPAYVNDMGQYAIQATTNLFNFLKSLYSEKSDTALWQMIEVTPMIGVNDVNVEQFTLANVDTLRNFAQLNHLGALSMWSLARDMPCADRWASPVCSGNNLQIKPYEFAQRFIING